MADGVTVDNGALTDYTASTDEGAGGHVQRVKLAYSADGSEVHVSADADGLLVNLGANNDVTVTGSVTANAGTNLNTSTLALEAGGNLAAAATSLAALDNIVSGNEAQVDIVSSALPTGASTLAEQQSQTTHLATIAGDTTSIQTAAELIDDAVVADDAAFTPATTKVMMAGFEFDDSAPDSVNEGDAGAARMSANRSVYTNIRDNAGNERGLNIAATGNISVDTVTTVTAVTAISNALPAGTNAIGKLAANSGVDIGDVDILSIAAGDNNIGNVDVVTLPNVTLAAGTNTNEVVGDIAHDTGVSGNPVQIAGAAQNMDDTAPPNRVSAESDVTRLATDRDGTQFVHPHGPQVWSYHDDDAAAVTTDGTVHAAPGAGLSLYVTDIVFSIGAATASSIFLEESTTKVLGPYYLEAIAGRGLALHFQTPKKITADTALLVTNTGSIAFSIDITGYTAQG